MSVYSGIIVSASIVSLSYRQPKFYKQNLMSDDCKVIALGKSDKIEDKFCNIFKN